MNRKSMSATGSGHDKAPVTPPTEAHLNEGTFGDNNSQVKFFDNQIEKLFTPDEVAAIFQVKKKTVYNWVYLGNIKGFKLNRRLLRFTKAEIDNWILAQKGQTNVN